MVCCSVELVNMGFDCMPFTVRHPTPEERLRGGNVSLFVGRTAVRGRRLELGANHSTHCL